MKRRAIIWLALCGASIAVTSSAQAQTAMHWQDYDQPGYKLTQARLYAVAELTLTNKLEQLNASGKANDSAILSYLEKLITVCASQNKFADAQDYCHLAIRFSEREHDYQRTAMLYTGLGNCLFKLHKLTQAELAFHKANDFLAKDPAAGAGPKAMVLSGIAELQAAEGKLDSAANLFTDVLALEKATPTGVSPSDLTRYARCLHSLGKIDQAKQALEQALRLDREQLGEEHPLLASNLNNMAILNVSCHDLNTAETQMAQALAIGRRWKYTDLPDWIENMAFVLDQENKSEQATKLHQEATALRSKHQEQHFIAPTAQSAKTGISNKMGSVGALRAF